LLSIFTHTQLENMQISLILISIIFIILFMVKNSQALAQFQSAFMQSKTGVKTVAITGYSGMIGTN